MSIFSRTFAIFFAVVLSCAFFIVSAPPSFAATGINRQFTYQGRLLDSTGVSVVDGTYSIKFSLYDAPSSGTRLWTANGTTLTPTAVSVSVSNGLFSVNLGDVSAGQNAFDISWFQDSLYLGVTVGADSEMTPLKRLTSVPYAFVAETLQGQYASSSVASTGGTLFSLHQTATDAASAARTALMISTSGTSNSFDFLIKAFSGSDVFTVSRQGNVTVAGTQLTSGVATFASNVLPSADNVNSLGSSSARWSGLDAVNTTSTNATSTSWFGFATASGTTVNATSATLTSLSSSALSFLNGTSTGWFGFSTASGTTLDALTVNAANLASSNVTFTGGTINSTTIGLSSAAAAIFSNVTSTNWFGFATASGTTLNALTVNASSFTTPNATITGGTIDGTPIGATTPSSGVFSNSTSTNLAFGSGSGTSLLVAGQTVCLTDGTNCDVSKQSGATAAGRIAYWAGSSQLTAASNFVWDATNSRLGVGTSTPSEALDVVGNVNNTLRVDQLFSVVATGTTIANPLDIKIAGKYAYVLGGTSNSLDIFDVTSPTEPVHISTFVLADTTSRRLAVAGKFVYVVGDSGLNIVDVADPTTPILKSTFGALPAKNGVVIAGKYAYMVSASGDAFQIFNVSDPTSPAAVSISNFGASPQAVAVDGKFAYIVNASTTGSTFSSVDVSDASNPVVLQQITTSPSPTDIVVQGGFAYVSNSSADTIQIINIKNPAAMTVAKTITLAGLSAPSRLSISGRYLYSTLNGSNALGIFDVTSSTNPITITTTAAMGSGPLGISVAGRYAYVTNSTDPTGNSFSIVDIHGEETNGLVAHSAELGNAQIMTDAIVGNSVSVGNSIDVGFGGILSQGGISVGGTSTTSQIIGNFEIGNGFVPFRFLRPTATQLQNRLIVGEYANADVVIGDATSSGMSAQFQLTGDDLFVTGNIGSASSVYSNGEFITGATHLSDGNVFRTSGALTLFSSDNNLNLQTMTAATISIDSFTTGAGTIEIGGSTIFGADNVAFNARVSSSIVPFVDAAYDLGSASAQWRNVYTSGTAALTAYSSTPLDIVLNSSSTNQALAVYKKCGAAADSNIAQFYADTGLGGAKQSNANLTCGGDWHILGSNYTLGADFAEYWHTDDVTIEAGDVVAIGAVATDIEKSTTSERDRTLGVISTQPGYVGNASGAQLADRTHWKIVGQLGLVPVKADASSDPIVAGDLLMAGSNGRAVKAHGVGKILGRALESLAAGLGTIQMYVKPEWSATDMFVAGSTGTDILPQGTATALNPTVDSMGLSFTGSSWDPETSTAMTSGFTLATDIQGVSSSAFSISRLGGPKLLTISDVGDVSVTGDLSVGHRLFLGSKLSGTGSTSTYLFVDDTQAPASTYIATNADGWSTATTYDYAERFHSDEALNPGDVVMADVSGAEKVIRSTSTSDVVLGIVSTRPGFITGANTTNTYPIALAGRVPTRVSTKNGPIVAGDQLSPSDIPGVAVKATGSGPVVGVALENYNSSNEGRISVFVQPGWKGGDVVAQANTPASFTYHIPTATLESPRSGLAMIAAGAMEVNVNFPTLHAYPLVTVTPYGQTTKNWWLTNVTDRGFTIIVGEAPTFDLTFAWKAEASHDGSMMSNSDGTAVTYDSLTGKPVLNPVATSTQDVMSISTMASVTSTIDVSGAVDVLPAVAVSSTLVDTTSSSTIDMVMASSSAP